jgi:putative transposase
MPQLSISDAVYHEWREEHGGVRVDQAKRLKELEDEKTRMRKLVADLSIDNSISKEADWVAEEQRLACQPFN